MTEAGVAGAASSDIGSGAAAADCAFAVAAVSTLTVATAATIVGTPVAINLRLYRAEEVGIEITGLCGAGLGRLSRHIVRGIGLFEYGYG